MKTLIVYATKYGCTKALAEKLSGLMEGAVLHNLKSTDNLPIAEFDCVIIGSSLYAGMIRKEAKIFINQNLDVLRTKRVGLFISSLQPGNADVNFSGNFPPELLKHAHVKGAFGGVFDNSKAGFIDKLIMKAVKKTSDSVYEILEDNIVAFANAMKEI